MFIQNKSINNFSGYYLGGDFLATPAMMAELLGKPNAGTYKNSWLSTYVPDNETDNEIIFGILPDTDAVEPSYDYRRYEIIAANKKENDIILQAITSELKKMKNDYNSVYKDIKAITEAYIDTISQMDNAVKDHNKYTKKRS